MKILLIIPRYNLTNKISYEYAFPIGLGYISSVLKKEGHYVTCLNLNHLNGAVEHLINQALNEKDYDFVCTGHMGIGYEIIGKIIIAARKHNSMPKIIIGGALITSESELMFNSLKPDFGILGEGDITLIELLNCLEKAGDLKKIDGICYRDKEGKLIFTKKRAPIMNLDSIPFPDLEGLGFEEYLKNQNNDAGFQALDYPRPYTILCSRGCPYQCTFCYHSIGIKYRMRSLDNIFKEIEEAIKKYDINALIILDDLFSIDERRLYDFCKRIKKISEKYKIDLKWGCQLSVNNVSEKMLRILKDSGVNVASCGFESFSSIVLKSMKKPITPEQIEKAVKLVFEVGMGLQGSFIFGDTAETKETAKETLDWWKKNCKGQIKLGFIQPYPGSEIWNHCIKKGIIQDKLDFIKNRISHTNWLNMTDKMTNEEILQLKKDILNARRDYYPYVIPSKIKRTFNNRYEVAVKCPFCKEKINYKNCLIENRIRFNIWTPCRKCNMRFFIVNRLSKFESDFYQQLDFLRRNYLYLRDRILKKRL